MHAAVSVINYIAESVASWEKKSGSMAKLWGSSIRFGCCAIMTDDVFAQPMTAPPKINIYNEHLHGTVTLLGPVLQREYAESEEKKRIV